MDAEETPSEEGSVVETEDVFVFGPEKELRSCDLSAYLKANLPTG